jgi:DNA-binding GntR family transcriptional regulator
MTLHSIFQIINNQLLIINNMSKEHTGVADTVLKTITEMVYANLRTEILRGHLRPGDRLTEQDIATRMGTSQGPVREAIARLRGQGLVITLTHRGSFVSSISVETARDIYNTRVLLESHAAALAITQTSEKDIQWFRETAARLVQRAADTELIDYFELDMAFHRRFFELSRSESLLQFWSTIELQTTKFVAVASPQIFRDPVSVAKTHFNLADALEAKDTSRLQTEIRSHVLRIWEVVDSESIQIRQGP